MDDYNQIDYKDGYTLVEYKGDYYVLDSKDEVVKMLSNDDEDWDDFIKFNTKTDGLDGINTDEISSSSNTVHNMPKSTTVKNLKKRYSDYRGWGWILTDDRGFNIYSITKTGQYPNNITENTVVFLDRDAAEDKIKYTSLKNIQMVKIRNGRISLG